MKKMISLALLCAMTLSLPALAEPSSTQAVPAENSGEFALETIPGAFMWIENGNEMPLVLTLPNGWFQGEVDEEAAASGTLYTAASEDESLRLDVIHETRETDFEALLAEIQAIDPEAVTLDMVEKTFIQYSDAASDAIVLLIPSETGVTSLRLSPASHENAAQIAQQIFTSIQSAEIEEEPEETKEN